MADRQIRSRDARPWHEQRRRPLPWWWLAGAVVLALGVAGFANLVADSPPPPGRPPAPPFGWVDVVYRSLRLFTLNLDVPDGWSAPWWLYVAAFAAPALTLRGIAELFRDQLTAGLVRLLVRPGLVIVGANRRARALIANSSKPGRFRNAIVVVDPDPAALATVTARRVWKVRGDAQSTESLRRCAVPDTAETVVVTGDNARNSTVTAAVLDLVPRPRTRLYVEVEEPGLARTLEQGGQRVDVDTTTFSSAELAAVSVLADRETPLMAAGPGNAPPTIAMFGTGALVDAAVLELHRRRRVHLLDDDGRESAPPRVLLFGPDAVTRRDALATLMGTELGILDLDPIDVDLDQVVELGADTARHLARHRPLRRVLVLTRTDLDGGGIAISLARHLGRDADTRLGVQLVVESDVTPFGDEIADQTGNSAGLAPVSVVRAPDIAYDLDVLRGERVQDRLARGLYEVENPGRPRWSDADRSRYLAEAARLAAIRPDGDGPGGAPAERGTLRRTSLVSLDRPELAPLEALGFDRPTALARAGLGVDFQSLTALVPAARKLVKDGHGAAFGVWAEVARLRSDPAELARDLPQDATGPRVSDVSWLLRLRRAVLRDPDARLALPDGSPGRAGPTGRVTTVVVLTGPGDRTRGRELLAPTTSYLLDELEVRTTAAARDLVGVGVDVRTPQDQGDPLSQSLALWEELLADGLHPGDVRVLAMADTPPDEMALARALGARIGRVERPQATDLNQVLLSGAAGIVPLPDDPMTVRAFLRPGRWPQEYADVRVPIARELHAGYVTRQRDHTSPDDPALRSWALLSTWLKESNLAVVDDITTKLAVLGLRLDDRVPGPPDDTLTGSFAANIELLAEMEHGRFTAERLLSGWTTGVRNPGRFLSPHLRSWAELSDDAKEIDRAVMRHVPLLLAENGLGARPIVD